jgi:hypothetical protein
MLKKPVEQTTERLATPRLWSVTNPDYYPGVHQGKKIINHQSIKI